VVPKKFLGTKTKSLKKIGEKLISEVAQTAAKKPSQFSENFSPVFLQSGKGAYVKDLEGNTFLDTIMGIGPIILGYNHPDTNKAIINQLKNGINFSLTHPIEIQLAVELKSILPNMDMFRFSKTGVDVTTAAIRAARNFTQKNKILSCGYHGWHDWNAITLNKNSGVPKFNSKLIKKFQYNNFEQMADNIDYDTAAVIMEPIIFEYPKDNFLKKIRKITKQKNVLLIFDEMWTGFRINLGGAQKHFKIDADLACYSKAIANGMPISVLAGKKNIMQSLNNNSFFYTTFGGETLSIASALSTIKFSKKNNVCIQIKKYGDTLAHKLNEIILSNKIHFLEVVGYGQRLILNINYEQQLLIKTYIHQEMLKNGILWNGIINLSYSHSTREIYKICTSFNKILKNINLIGLKNLQKNIHGKLIKKLLI
jgi:glutamate-1-semialdehyde aminotransferase